MRRRGAAPISFFEGLDKDVGLHLVGVKAHKSGMVELRYEVKGDAVRAGEVSAGASSPGARRSLLGQNWGSRGTAWYGAAVTKRALPPHPATVVQRRVLGPHPATVVQASCSAVGWPSRPIHDTSARPSRAALDRGLFRPSVGAVQCKACGTVQRAAAAAPTTVQVTVDGHYWLWTTDLSITVLGTRFPDDLGAAPAHDLGRGRLRYLIGSKWHETGWTSWKAPGMTKSQHIERKVVAAIETAVSGVRGKVKATVLDIVQGNTPCSGEAGCAMWFANGGGDIFASSKTAVVRLKSHTTYESSLLPFYPTNTYHSTRHSDNDNDVEEDGYFIFHNIVKSWTPTPCSSCFP